MSLDKLPYLLLKYKALRRDSLLSGKYPYKETRPMEVFISEFKERFGEEFFLQGGCYIFARILQVRYGGVIYSDTNHCVLRTSLGFYDITGKIEDVERYKPIDSSEEQRYKLYCNFM